MDFNVQPRLLSEAAELQFPQAHTMTVTATAIGSNDQLFRFWVALDTHTEPPPPDGLHGESRGVMVGADAHPRLISADVVNPIRISASEFLVDKVVNLDLHGLAAG